MPSGPGPNGGASPRDQAEPGGKTRKQSGNNSMGLAGLVCVPLLMFTTLSVLFAFGFHHFPAVCWVVVVAWVMVSVTFMVLDARHRMSGSWFLLLGSLCLCAVACAVVCGLYNYRAHLYQYWSYAESRTYTNVLPTEPSEAHEDAGTIVFASSARVDTTRAVGYKSGAVYCVAPIMDETQADRVEYWAAGVGCCPARGDFACDDVWDSKARSGVVIVDPLFGDETVSSERTARMTFWKSDWEHYMKAVSVAEGNYGMISSQHPLFVRWVSDPQRVQDEYWTKGIGFLIGSVAIHLLASIIMGTAFQMYSKRSAGSQASRSARPGA